MPEMNPSLSIAQKVISCSRLLSFLVRSRSETDSLSITVLTVSSLSSSSSPSVAIIMSSFSSVAEAGGEEGVSFSSEEQFDDSLLMTETEWTVLRV